MRRFERASEERFTTASEFADLPPSWMEKHEESARMEFHPNSRLIKINGCINEQNCGFYDYVMVEGKGLRLVRKELLAKEFQ